MPRDRGGDEGEKEEEEESDGPPARGRLQHPPTASSWLQTLLVGLAQVAQEIVAQVAQGIDAQVAQGQVLATWISN